MTTPNPWVSKFAPPLLGYPNVHQAARAGLGMGIPERREQMSGMGIAERREQMSGSYGGSASRSEHMLGVIGGAGGGPIGQGTERVEHAGAAHQVGVTVQEVEALHAQTAAAMEATNEAVEACGGNMASTDLTTWRGIYAGWQSIDKGYQDLHSSTLQWMSLGGVYVAYLLKLGSLQDQFNSYLAQVPGWQRKVQMACPNYSPPPSPAPPPAPGTPGAQPQTSWFCQNLGLGCPQGQPSSDGVAWTTTIVVVAVVVGLVTAFWFFSPVVGAYLAGRRLTRGGGGYGGGYGEDDYSPHSRRLRA